MATAAGAPPYHAWGNVPGGEQNLLSDLRNQFESLIGYTQSISTKMLLAMANSKVLTLRDFGSFADAHAVKYGVKLDSYPWAKYGLEKDQYNSISSVFSVEYQKVTGTSISPSALQQAFRNPQAPGGGLLTGSQYQQQLMQDANIQKTFGWVKYGMDYSQWQQQKLSMRTELGRDIKDSEAATLLQYQTQAKGSNQNAVARVPQQQPSVGAAGIGQSVIR